MRAKLPRLAIPCLTIACLALSACGGTMTRSDGPPSGSSRIPGVPDDAVPRPEARSRYGNGPVYEVFGKHYTVMPSSIGYQERGVASWYGKKFHGNLTSNRETYDMYEMTAAHKTLPLPTYVRVRNLSNNKTIIVRVNDRGPFVNNRIIDLSYSAAMKLDIVKDGTGMVEVTAISYHEPRGDRPVRRNVGAASAANGPEDPPTERTAPTTQPAATSNKVYVQVGAFGDRANAERRLGALSLASVNNAFIHEERSPGRTLYRVRIGPVADVVQYDLLVEELEGIGITDPYLISE